MKALKQLVFFVFFFLSWFYWCWGFNYYRQTPEQRFDLAKVSKDTTLFYNLLDEVIENANSSYVDSYSRSKLKIDSSLEEAYDDFKHVLKCPKSTGSRRTKEMIFSNFIAKSRILGYFGPFFNEVHVNANLLPFQYPFTLAHEKAHQMGIASEAECNLWAYIVTKSSPIQEIRYSGALSTLQYFLREAYHTKHFTTYVSKIDERVIDDIKEQRDHWRNLRDDKIDKIQSAAYDTYLKANSVSDGVRDYNRVVSLIIAWDLRENQKKED